MKSMRKFSLLVIGMLTMVQIAEAGRIHRREKKQAARITEGVKSGELTREEAHKLRKEGREIRKEVREDRKGGLSPEERKDIEKKQDARSKEIYDLKHNEQERKEGSH